MTVKAIVVPSASANIYSNLTIDSGANGELPLLHQDTSGYAAIAVTDAVYNEIQSVALANAALGDYCLIAYARQAGHASDTVDAVVRLYGFLVSYTADS